MRDKGTNELRITVTDLTDAVLNWKVGINSDMSKNSIICRVLDKWAREVVMKSLRKQDRANLDVHLLKSYGVDPALFRQSAASGSNETAGSGMRRMTLAETGSSAGGCREMPDNAASMPLSPAHRQ